MAESDRPVPDASQPKEAAERPAASEGGLRGEMYLEDGTPVREASASPSSDEIEELLQVFKGELGDEGFEPLPDLSAQEAAEEELLRQAEALLGTADPQELEELAELHRSEAAEQVERLSKSHSATPSGLEPARTGQQDAANEAPHTDASVSPPGASRAGGRPASAAPAARPSVSEESLEPVPAPPASESSQPAIHTRPSAEAAAAPAPAEGAGPRSREAILEPPPPITPAGEAEGTEDEADAAPARSAAFASAPVSATQTPARRPSAPVPAPAAPGRGWLRALLRIGWRVVRWLGGWLVVVLRKLAASPLVARLVEPVRTHATDFGLRLTRSKAGLAVSAGVLASLAAYLGFALFEARFSTQVLQRRFPDATTAGELSYFQAVDDLRHGRWASAKQRLRAVRASAPDTRQVDVLFALGEAYYHDEHTPVNFRFAQAREYYAAAIAADPNDPRVPEIHLRIAESFRRQRLWSDAERAYGLVLERYKRRVEPAAIYYALGEIYAEQRAQAQAADAFERVWNEYPSSPLAAAARLRHGDVLAEQGRVADAAQLWTPLAAPTSPSDVRWEAVQHLAAAAEQEGDLRAALAWLEAWLEGAPSTADHPSVLLKYARALQRLGRPGEAGRALDYLLATYADADEAVRAALMRGAMLRADGEGDAAKELYRDYLLLAPEDPRILAALRDAYLEDENYDKAIEYAKRAAAAATNSAAEQFRLGQVYAQANAPARAMKVYWEMLARYPLAVETRQAVNELIDLLQAQGHVEEAYRVVEMYATMATDAEATAAAHEAKASLLAGMDLWEQAAQELHTAVQVHPTTAHRLALAEAQVRIRDWPGVLDTLDAFDPNDISDEDYVRYAWYRVRAFLSTGATERGGALLDAAATRLSPLPPPLVAMTAEVQMQLGNTDRAREAIARLDGAHSDGGGGIQEFAATYLAWADHLYASKAYPEAAAVYGRIAAAARDTHESAWAAYQVGNCYTQMEDYTRAADAYAAMIAAHPKTPWTPFAREKALFAELQADARQRASRT